MCLIIWSTWSPGLYLHFLQNKTLLLEDSEPCLPSPTPALQDSHSDTSFPDHTLHSTVYLSCKPSDAPDPGLFSAFYNLSERLYVGLSPRHKHPKKSSTETMQRAFQNPTDTTGFLLGSGIRHVPHMCPRRSSKYTQVLSPGGVKTRHSSALSSLNPCGDERSQHWPWHGHHGFQHSQALTGY